LNNMKYIILTLVITLLFSCESSQNKSLQNQIDILKTRNDSLTQILEDIENKYVFDSISFREIPNRKNDIRLNGQYGLELVVVGYSADRNYFTKYDTIIDDKMINPKVLKRSNGGFKFNMKLDRKENLIKIKMDMTNKYGKSEKGNLFDIIKAY